MKKLLLAGLAALFSSTGFGALITLSDYLALGPGGTTIGTTVFSNFTLLSLQSGALPIPTSILVNQINLAGNPGLEFVTNQTAAPGELFQLRLSYQVQEFSITGASVSLANAVATGDAAITGILNATGPMPSPGPLTAFAIEGLDELTSQTMFAGVPILQVETDIVVDGGPPGMGGSGTLGSAVNQFAVTPVPEPGTVLFGLAGCAVVLLRRVRKV